MDIGLLILCPEIKKSDLKVTCCSASRNLYNRDMHCVVPKSTKQKEFASLKEICPSISRGSNTITSLINSGIKKLKNDWIFIVWSGTSINSFIERKFKYANQDNVMLFPVFDNHWDFVNGPFNGILINKSFSQKAGEFKDDKNFEESKIFWAGRFLESGGIMKGIVGLRV